MLLRKLVCKLITTADVSALREVGFQKLGTLLCLWHLDSLRSGLPSSSRGTTGSIVRNLDPSLLTYLGRSPATTPSR